jgi:DNA-binding MarR family transcriptional regulator
MRWRRSAEAALSSTGLTVTQWLVLSTLEELVREQDEPASQQQVAERAQVDKMTTSQVMRALEARGMVDRAASFDARYYRVIVTRRGEQALAAAGKQLDAASRESFRRLTTGLPELRDQLREIG